MRSCRWLLLALLTVPLAPAGLMAQQRCGFDVLQERIKHTDPLRQKRFEDWISKKVKSKTGATERTKASIAIPVVVHVIHNGEPIGTGLNIPMAQIQSQIDVLNKDYQRLNADKVNTPAEFVGVAAGIDLSFVLAKQDPEGLPSDGVVRVQGSKSGWTIDNGSEFKSLSYWPAEDYMNIWVVNLTDQYLGFAQFPVTELPGVEGPFDRLTDGVVSDYRAFGTIDAGSFNLDPQYNKGRTMTHEIGHFLSLLHIFGEDTNLCNTTDFVDDTPQQPKQTLNCPSHPVIVCGHPKMFQNFLDYTDDGCMNLFTAGQIARMNAILQNSPRRQSLTTSKGLQAPVILPLDLEARRVVAPFSKTCGQAVVPRLELRNRGATKVSSATIQLSVNGVITETKNFTMDLDHLELLEVSFTAINFAEPSSPTVAFQVLQVNGSSSDGDTGNNTESITPQVTARISPPFTEPFNTIPSSWQVVNQDNGVTWQNVTAPKTTTNNKAAFINFFNYENDGSKDRLHSPFINLSGGTPILKFDRSYAQFPNNVSDVLTVHALPGCSSDMSQAITIFSKSGSTLSTATPTSSFFVPSSQSQWVTETISLNQFLDQNVQLIFESTNGFGNNLYLDNFTISNGQFSDVTIVSLVTPGPVFCVSNPSPVIEVQNLGTTPVTTLKVTTKIDNTVTASQTFSNLNLVTGASKELTLAPLPLQNGESDVTITIEDPNASVDQTPTDNTSTYTRVLNKDEATMPYRQEFEGSEPWTIVSDKDQFRWTMESTNFGTSLVYKAFSNTNLTEKAWIVTPTFDLTSNDQGSLFFTTSYGKRSSGIDRLQVLVSEDCGIHYANVLFDKTAADLANTNSDVSWSPSTAGDWTQQYVSLNDYAGKDNIRFAFVATNDHGNNIFLDNIEWFVEDNPNPPRIAEFFSVYSSETNPFDFFITFNLPEKIDARLVVYNTMGQVLIDSDLPETLNQTYTVNLFGQSTGVYIARLQAGDQVGTTKLFVGN